MNTHRHTHTHTQTHTHKHTNTHTQTHTHTHTQTHTHTSTHTHTHTNTHTPKNLAAYLFCSACESGKKFVHQTRKPLQVYAKESQEKFDFFKINVKTYSTAVRKKV